MNTLLAEANADDKSILNQLDKINKLSVVESSVVVKAIDAITPTENGQTSVDIISESDHNLQHAAKVRTLSEQIKSGVVDNKTVILSKISMYSCLISGYSRLTNT